MTRVPPPRAAWRGHTRPCGVCGDSVLSFDLASGGTLRLTIDARTRADLVAVCAEEAPASQVVCRDHAARSPGSPQVDGSIPDDGQKL